jgi:hypothetical protein
MVNCGASGNDPGDAFWFVEAELTDPKGSDGAMEGVRYVLHVASPIPSSMNRTTACHDGPRA